MKRILFYSWVWILLVSACSFPKVDSAETPTQEPTEQSDAVPLVGEIQQPDMPGDLPPDRENYASDTDSSITAKIKYPIGGDRFTFGRYERPFIEYTMEVYFPALDLVETLVYLDADWVYGIIVLSGTDEHGALSGNYALELDLDIDGRGDWLVMVSQPESAQWTTEAVRIYHDTDQSVGGTVAMKSDYDSPGDGFETLVFENGLGDVPDFAWVRVPSQEPPNIQIAVKRSALGDFEGLLINMWAGTSDLDPSLFDFNDFYTHEQAGAADPGLEFFYPIKELSELDNSCKMAVGFEPTGAEPGLCPAYVPQDPDAPPPTKGPCKEPPGGCPTSYTWNQGLCECVYDPPPPK